jgi:hypothetical protein
MTLTIYIPSGRTPTGIAPGSGIVGRPQQDGQILCYYEGNLYGSENLKLYRERLMHAAGRMIQHAPTIAMMLLPSDALLAVGRYDPDIWAVAELTDPDAASAWAGEPVHAIVGDRFPCGPLDVNDPAVRRTLGELRPVKREGFRSLWRSTAGQIIEHRPDRVSAFEVIQAK